MRRWLSTGRSSMAVAAGWNLFDTTSTATSSKAATAGPPTLSGPPGPDLSRTPRGLSAEPKGPHSAAETPKSPAGAEDLCEQFPKETANGPAEAGPRGAEGI
jgi:hypothetical protein